ncbi:hypothetical protein [Nostoc sp.]|uniref:hypothetical protein n=1 Tax=Nostoc sp. TaxID=1180 RepID=UPI002FF4F044
MYQQKESHCMFVMGRSLADRADILCNFEIVTKVVFSALIISYSKLRKKKYASG